MSIDFSIDTEFVFTAGEVLEGTSCYLRDLTLATDIPELTLYRILGGDFYLCHDADPLIAGLFSMKMAGRTEEALIVISDADSELGLPRSIYFEVAKTRANLEYILVIAVAIYCGEEVGVDLCDHSGFWTGECDVEPRVLREMLTRPTPSASLEDTATLIVGNRRKL